MILKPSAYLPQSEKKHLDIKMSPSDLLAREEKFEMDEARKIMEQILNAESIKGDEELKKLVECTGPKWFERGDNIVLPWRLWFIYDAM